MAVSDSSFRISTSNSSSKAIINLNPNIMHIKFFIRNINSYTNFLISIKLIIKIIIMNQNTKTKTRTDVSLTKY